MGRAFGWSYDDLVMHVVDEALMRSQSQQRRRRPRQRGVRRVSGTLTAPALRHLTAADRGRIEEITRAVRVFRDDEVPVALEVFDAAVAGSPDYTAVGADLDGQLGRLDLLGPHPLHPRHLRPLLDGGGPGGALRGDRHCPDAGNGRPAGRVCAAHRRGDGRATRLPANLRFLRGPRLPPRGRDPRLLRPRGRPGGLREGAGRSPFRAAPGTGACHRRIPR